MTPQIAPTTPLEPSAVRVTSGTLEAVARIGHWAGWLGYLPPDSREVESDCTRWGIEFEALYTARVASGEWAEDAYIEQVDAFAVEKLRTVQRHCTRFACALLASA